MLARLRHNAFIGGDDEQGGVDPADAGQHILDEVAVARHIDDADCFPVWQVQPSESRGQLSFDGSALRRADRD